MSAEFEFTRDNEGFLTCKYCPKIFFTEILFKKHSSNQHKNETKLKGSMKSAFSTLLRYIGKPRLWTPNLTYNLGIT